MGQALTIKRSKDEARRTLEQRRADADARAREAIDVLRRATAAHQHQAALTALQAIMIRGRTFVFDMLDHVLRPHVWAVDDTGAVVGHVLTITDAALIAAADGGWIDVLTLPEALDRPWCDPVERAAWRAEYAAALRRIADNADAVERSLADRAALMRTAGLEGGET